MRFAEDKLFPTRRWPTQAEIMIAASRRIVAETAFNADYLAVLKRLATEFRQRWAGHEIEQ